MLEFSSTAFSPPLLAVAIAVLCVPVVGVFALHRAGAFVVAEESAFIRVQRRLARERGTGSSVSDRLRRGGLMRRLDDARDLRRLLIVAGLDMTPGTWGLRVISWTLGAVGLAVLVNAVSALSGNGVVLSWPIVVLLVLVVPLLAILRLRLRARRYRENAGRAFSELAAVLAALGNRPPLRNPANIEATDLVAMVASWIDDPSLRAITDGNRWRQLADEARIFPASESEWFQVIGELYEIPAASRVAEVVRISRELNARDVSARYLLTARDLTRERLANLRTRNRRAMVTQVVPMLGLVAALMILVLSAVATIHLGGS